MSAYNLHRVFRARRLALIGASDREGSLGRLLTLRLLTREPRPELHLVNPRHARLYGQDCLPDAHELPEDLDLAVVIAPWSSVPAIVEGLIARRCAAALVVGMARESGWFWQSRAALLEQLARRVQGKGLRLIGPASAGVVLGAAQLDLSFGIGLAPPGGIAALSRSGSPLSVVAAWARQHRVGLSAMAALGDRLDVNLADALDYFAEDEDTRAVLLHLEDFGTTRRLLSAARACAFRKPVLALPVPRETGGPPGWTLDRGAVLRRALERAGVLCVDDLDALCVATNVDLPTWPHASRRFAVLGNSPSLLSLGERAVRRIGGELAVCGRPTLERLAGVFPERSDLLNPLDVHQNVTPAQYAAAVPILAADPEVDVVLVIHHEATFSTGEDVARALQPPPADQATLITCFTGAGQSSSHAELGERGIASFPTPDAAVKAYALNRRYFEQRAALTRTVPPMVEDDAQLIGALAQTLKERAEDDPELLPLLLKQAGFSTRLSAWSGLEEGDAEFGLQRDPEAGLQLYVAASEGQAVEPLAVSRRDCATLAARWRGWARADADLRAQLPGWLYGLALIAEAFPALARLDLGGVHRDAGGELLLGWFALIDSRGRVPLAYAPPPRDIDRMLTARDGMPMRLRAIRAEDERELQVGFTRLSAEEVRMRFMFPLKAMTHELAARLTQLDYDRELAYVLAGPEPPGQAQIYGVARASFHLASRSAEFAITIPRQLSGQGLGTRLLGLLIEQCRLRGLREIYGDTLKENAGMRVLAAKLGFLEEAHPDDPGIVRIRRPL